MRFHAKKEKIISIISISIMLLLLLLLCVWVDMEEDGKLAYRLAEMTPVIGRH